MMETLAERLGFSDGDRIAVIHADDIGMCHAANEGAFEVLESGPATCGSIMVPCPWFPEAARRARRNPNLDLGVHLTLNSEWEHYRWGPVSGASAVPSLVDAEGFFPRTAAEVAAHAKPDEVAVELRAQVQRALDAGVDVTHVDTHMGTCFFPPFVEVYAEIAREFRVPAFVVDPSEAALAELGLESARGMFRKLVLTLGNAGMPILDGFDADSLDFAAGEGIAHNEKRLARMEPGVNYLICHPARAGDELSAIAPEAHARDFERTFYGGDAGRRALEAEGILTVGMRPIRDLLRGAV